jgi:hypothetical protein
VISQNLVCVDYNKLLTDSSELHDFGFPYIKINKTVNSAGIETGIIVYFQDFYKYLLYDIDTLNFELFSFNKNSRVLKVPIDEKFKVHKLEPRYKINSFYVVENKLYLLVFNTIYVYEISKLKVCKFLKSYKINQMGFEWFSMVNQNSGILFRSETEATQQVKFFKFQIKNNKIVITDSLNLHFDGLKYLRSESSFISDDKNMIFIGNATSSKIVVIEKQSLNIKNSFYHSKLVNSNINDTPNYKNKYALHNSIHSDSINFHYQTCYFSDNIIYRSRSKIVGKSPHFLDVYRLTKSGWDSVQTLCEGMYNFKKKYRDTSAKFGIMHFDPMSTVSARIAINGSFYAVGFSFDVLKDYTKNNVPYYIFPFTELSMTGKSSIVEKKYKFNLYEYKLVY